MKAYGLPRTDDVLNPDVADIKTYGLASRVGRLDDRSYFKNSASKRATRRYWKRRARAEGKIATTQYEN